MARRGRARRVGTRLKQLAGNFAGTSRFRTKTALYREDRRLGLGLDKLVSKSFSNSISLWLQTVKTMTFLTHLKDFKKPATRIAAGRARNNANLAVVRRETETRSPSERREPTSLCPTQS